MKKEPFDYSAFREQAIARLMSGDKELTGKEGVLAPLLKDFLDAVLSGELQADAARPTSRRAAPTAATAANPNKSRLPTAKWKYRCHVTGTAALSLNLSPSGRPPWAKAWITASCLFTAKASPTRTSSSTWRSCTAWTSARASCRPSPTRSCRWWKPGAPVPWRRFTPLPGLTPFISKSARKGRSLTRRLTTSWRLMYMVKKTS